MVAPRRANWWWLIAVLVAMLESVAATPAASSTYAVYIPLDSSIYTELETLNGLGYLHTYLDEIKPISRVEAARLTLEAEGTLDDSERTDPLARSLVRTLRTQLHEEISWLENNTEDDQPTMFHPVERLEMQYVFSRGEQRRSRTSVVGSPSDSGINAEEGTPLLPNNDALPTAPGSNEIFRWSGWIGLGGFFTAYGEGAVAGPLTREMNADHADRIRPLGTAVVASLGNFAISLGDEEMRWGTGHFAALSQGNNNTPFPALRIENIHPTLLPGFLRYLGQFRYQLFFGQLDDDRYFAHPWIDGQIFSFKPLPNFEFGFTHAIDFGGRHNDSYSLLGFLGRATGFATGNPRGANTHQRGGVYLKFYFPRLRGLEIYQEIVGNDNLTYEIPGIGRFLPFLAVSYQGGFYLPRLTADGLTDLRLEYSILEPNDQAHGDSLYWTYNGRLMGNPLGPNASEVDVQFGRWFDLRDKFSTDIFYTERAPAYGNFAVPTAFYPYALGKEHSGGIAFDLLRVPRPLATLGDVLPTIRARAVFEYAHDLNYQANTSSARFLVIFSGAFTPRWPSWSWH